MKTGVWLVLLVMMTEIGLSAQEHEGGVYKNWQDYSNGILFSSFNPDSSGKIKLHHFYSGKYIDVYSAGKKNTFHKDSIFGYRDSHMRDYRFYKSYDQEYRILENKSIVIYSGYVLRTSSTGKTQEAVSVYYFSTTLDGELIPLTILNLKKAFPDNQKFHDMLDLSFGDGSSLSSYDVEHQMYEVNYLLAQSLTQ